MKNMKSKGATIVKMFSILTIVAVIGFSFIACGDGGNDDDPGINTTALDAAIQDAGTARDGVITASDASDVPAGRKWVTESDWNAFDAVYKTAVEIKKSPSSQSAVDTAKTNLQSALVTFNAAKKDGSGDAITLSGTITVKNNGQIVPYVKIDAHNENWSWSEGIKITSSAANTPWEIITKPFSSDTEISFDIYGFDNDKYENCFFRVTADVKKTVYNTDVNNIAINLDLNLITISGTLNLDYGKVIPSVTIEINRKDNGNRLGDSYIYNVGNSAAWSANIPSQASDTDVIFNVVGFDGPIPWEYDQLFALWGLDFGVKVGNQNKTDIVLDFITLSGTVNVTYDGNPVPFVNITIYKVGEDYWEWLANKELHSPAVNTPWTFVIPAFAEDTEIIIYISGNDESGETLFQGYDTTRIVKNTNVSGIVLSTITLSGTVVNVTYSPVPILEISISKGVGKDREHMADTKLHNPSANTPWSITIPAFTVDTEITIWAGFLSEDRSVLGYHVEETRIVKNTNVSGIVLDLENY